MVEEMKRIAMERGVVLTDNAEKIAKVRERLEIPLNVCPCARDDMDRGCISAKCMREIQEEGICHCQCYKRAE